MKKSQPQSFDRIKATILVTWREKGAWDLNRRLRAKLNGLQILQPYFFDAPGIRVLEKLSRKCAEIYIPIRALAGRKETHVVFSWSMRMGIFYGLLNRLFDSSNRPYHVARDFHVNLIRKDGPYRMKLLLLRWALPGIDYFLCTSKAEETIYSRLFGIEPSKIRFFPDSPAQRIIDFPPIPIEDYIFSYGNSDRDFDTLIEAARLFEKPVIILSQNYRPKKKLPSNVRLILRRVSETRLIHLIQAARVVVLPLKFHSVAAGQNTLLEAMSLGRPLVVSANIATRHYAQQGRTALFYKPRKPSELANCVMLLWKNPDWAERIGKQAREQMRDLRGSAIHVLYDLLGEMFDLPST